jgi:hypothetical protein
MATSFHGLCNDFFNMLTDNAKLEVLFELMTWIQDNPKETEDESDA